MKNNSFSWNYCMSRVFTIWILTPMVNAAKSKLTKTVVCPWKLLDFRHCSLKI